MTPRIRATLRTARDTARGFGVSAGLLPYRPHAQIDADGWNSGYASGEWDRMAGVAEAGRYAVLVGYLRLAEPQATILDVGCGQGLLREHLVDVPFRRYVGTDVSSTAIGRARRLEDDRTEFGTTDVDGLAPGAFDVVVCNEMLYYVDAPSEFLASLRGVLRPGGHLLTSIWRHPGDGYLHALLDSTFDLVDRVELRSSASRSLRWSVAWHRRDTDAAV